jgi:SAM-dependent methyltransferase
MQYDAATLARLADLTGDRYEDTLSRLDPKGGVATILRDQLTAYLDLATCRGTRWLDFGCGVGSSTLALARLLPDATIIGVELDAEKVAMANHLRTVEGLQNLSFHASPAGDRLPDGIGTFDYVMLSAVFEHLLPNERRTTMSLIWNALRPGGILFINQTPHRWFPKELHTTGLWGMNYLPDPLAHAVAQRFGRLRRAGDWRTYLRYGIRGGTERELLRAVGPNARIRQPRQGDRASFWLAHVSPRHYAVKRVLANGFRLCDRLFGTIPSTHLNVAIQKQ